MSTWEKYRDMIDLPYPGESKHTRMPVRDRAAQFAPFAALTGYGAVLKETERITEKRIELDEYEKEKLNENLRLLLEKQESRPEITVTFFVPDEKKDGGAYRTISGHIREVPTMICVARDGAGRQERNINSASIRCFSIW